MSVWPNIAGNAPLSGSEGALVSVSVSVEPRDLEAMLDALAKVDFPINPQIFHDGEIVCIYSDGPREARPATIIEFPAYEARLPEIRGTLQAHGFPANAVFVAGMLDEIHSDEQIEKLPPGSPWVARIWRKRAKPLVSRAAS